MALLPKKPKQNFWDKVRDTFDANTEADQAKRVAQGQPALYQRPNYASPVSAVTSVARRALPNTSFNNPVSVASGIANRIAPMSLRDRFDSNTPMDYQRRAQATQTPYRIPTSYEDQQAMLGNKRPFTNFGQQVLGNTARVGNTLYQYETRTLPQAYAGLTAKALNRTGILNNQQYNRGVNKVLTDKNVYGGYTPKGGVLNAGTVIDSPEQAKNLQFKDVAQKSLGYGMGTYGEISPVGAKGKFLPRTLQGGAEAAIGDIGSQLVNTGRVNVRQTVGSTLFGGGLANAGPAASKLLNKASIPIKPKGTPKSQVDISALEETNKGLNDFYQNNSQRGLSDNHPTQTRIRQIYNQNQDAIRQLQMDQGGYIKNPLANDAPQVGKTDINSKMLAEAKKRGYGDKYTQEGQIANTVDELMKEMNAVRDVGIPLLDKYKAKMDGKTSIEKLMTPAELKAYKQAQQTSDNASNLLKEYFDSKKSTPTPQVGKTDPVLGESYYRATDRNEIDAVLSGRGKFGTHEVGKEGLTHVTPDKSYAEQYMKSSPDGVMVEFKPTSDTMKSRNGYGITKDDIARVTDTNGNVIYEASASTKPAPKQVSIKNSGASADNVVTRIELDGRKYDMTEDQLLARLIEERKTPSSQRSISQQDRISRLTQALKDLQEPKTASTKPPVFERDLNTGKMKYQSSAPQVGKTPKPTVVLAPKIKAVDKPRVSIRNPELEAINSDSAIRQMAGIIGEDVGQSNTGLGLVNQAISGATGGKYTNIRGLNPFRKIADAGGERLTTASESAITGKGSKIADTTRSVFAGSGLADETKQIGRIKQGILANTNDLITRTKKQLTETIDGIEGGTEALDRVMRDNKYIKRVYGDGAKKLSPNSLSPELRAVHDKLIAINKLVNDINYKTGVINKEQWMGGRKGSHIARIFDIPKDEKTVIRETLGQMFESTPGIKRKDISKMTDDVIKLLDKDPAHAVLIRQELALRNLAVAESMDAYAERGFIKKFAPNDNFLQVNGKKYGKYDGWYIEKGVAEELGNTRIFDNQLAQAFSDLALKYRGSAVGVVDSLIKSFKTAGTPGTILGNVMSNIVAFTPGAGTNPIYQAFDMIDAARKMAKGLTNADVFEARQLGVIGGDTAKQMFGDKSVTTALTHPSKNVFKRVHAKMGQFYGAIDDAAKLGLWTRLKKQGLDPQTAALEVAKFTQDYNNVGRVITLIADTPVLGKPFARFAPELVRIMKNNVTRSPHTVVASLALLAGIANEASKASGELEEGKSDSEDRKARETSVGETQIPGTKWINQLVGGPDRDISLNIAAGDSAVNIARSVGLNFPIEPGGDANTALLESLLPVEVPTRKNELGETVFDPTKVVTSMTVRPLIEQALDRNFMGGRITDPSNRQYDTQGNEMKYTELPANEQRRNRGAALFSSLAPAGSEINAIASSIQGKPSVTGKERSLKESLLRGVGIKVTSNDAEARQKRTDVKEYYDVDKKSEQEFLKNNKDLESLYFKVYPKTKDRETGKKISDQISPEKWTNIKSDTSGRLFNFIRQEQIRKGQADEKYPVDPIFQIKNDKDVRQVLELRSRPTAEDIEMDNIMEATQPWYRKLKKAEQDFYKKQATYYDSLGLPDTQNQRAKDYAAIQWPEQPALVQKYYALKQTNPDAAKELFKTTNLSDEFDKYSVDKLNYYNAKRKIEGVPPLSATTFDNVTFGYEEDEGKVFNELKYGKGYGGYGGGSGGGSSDSKFTSPKQVTTLKGKISLKTVKAGAKARAIAKPKVSIRKSRV